MPNNQCASIRAKRQVTTHTQHPPNPTIGLPSFQNINFFGKDFMESLLNFMHHSHNFLVNWQRETGHQQYTMSTEDRQFKINQIMNLIAQKEKELSELQAMKVQLTNDDTFSTFSSLTEELRSPTTQQSYEYAVESLPEECYEDEHTVAETQYLTAPEYSTYDNQAVTSTPNASRGSVQPQYSTVAYTEMANNEYVMNHDGAIKYFRSQ